MSGAKKSTTIAAKADEVARALQYSGEAGFDPGSIIAIITAILGIFQNCKLTPQQAQQRMRSPGRLDLVVIRREVRKQTTGRQNREALEAALLDVGQTLTTADVKSMYAEANL